MPGRPNILFILADQFRDSALGYRGEDPTHTPVLDALALESKDVTHAVSNYPVCSPHRAMLMTGQHPHRNGVAQNVNSRTGAGLRPDVPCWADTLLAAGYRTGYIGKWHLEAVTAEDEIWGEGLREGTVWDAYSPLDRRHGFSFWHSYGAGDDHLHPHYWVADAPREAKTVVDRWSVEHETDVAIDFLRDSAERGTGPDGEPFALVVSYNPPHQPFDLAPDTFRHLYERLAPEQLLTKPNVDWDSPAAAEAVASAPLYFAAVSAVDHQLGRLLGELEALGLAEDTIVVFTSDHGMQLGSHGLMYKNVPWEESMALPLLIRWPARIRAGRDDGVLLASVDLAPTLLGLAGLGSKIPEVMQGRDLSGALLETDRSALPDAALYYAPPTPQAGPERRGLRTLCHKLIATPTDGGSLELSLYDLRADPYELDDIAAIEPELAARLAARLLAEIDAVEDPWTGRSLLATR